MTDEITEAHLEMLRTEITTRMDDYRFRCAEELLTMYPLLFPPGLSPETLVDALDKADEESAYDLLDRIGHEL